MFNKVTIDLLFNLLLSFVVLFFLSFILINETETKSNTVNDNNILITMKWETNNDVDLWLLLPDGRKVGYPSRDKPPAHLDVDVVRWRTYSKNGNNLTHDNPGEENLEDVYIIKSNEEIITIRDVLTGEYIVNCFYYDRNGYFNPIDVEITIQDIKNNKMIYAAQKQLSLQNEELFFVRFFVKEGLNNLYDVVDVEEDFPKYFVVNK